MTGRVGIAISLIAAGAALSPAVAQATVVERSGSTLTVEASRKQVNHIQLRAVSDDAVAFRDRRAGLTTNAVGCRQAGKATVQCDTEGVERILIEASDRSDKLLAGGEFPTYDVTADMGRGNDSVRLGFKPADAENSTLGQIVVSSGAGNDSVRVGFKASDIDLSTMGSITVDTGAGNDNLRAFKPSDVELSTVGQFTARLGAGNDRGALGLLGTMYGGDGKDRLIGGQGAQALYGERGRDHLEGGAGDGDVCDGGADRDRYGPGCETANYDGGDTGTHEPGPFAARR